MSAYSKRQLQRLLKDSADPIVRKLSKQLLATMKEGKEK